MPWLTAEVTAAHGSVTLAGCLMDTIQSTKAGRVSQAFQLVRHRLKPLETTIQLEKRLYEETNKREHTCDREIKLTRLAGEMQMKRENIKPELARKNRPFLE